MTSLTSTSLSSHANSATASSGLLRNTSGTTPLVTAATIFCRCGANGAMFKSI
jgi:hypothetical protein